mgnify:CR=1 FL=1
MFLHRIWHKFKNVTIKVDYILLLVDVTLWFYLTSFLYRDCRETEDWPVFGFFDKWSNDRIFMGNLFLHRKENNSFSTSSMYYTKVAWKNMTFEFNHLSSLGYVCWIMYVNCREISVKLKKKRWKIGKFLFLIRQVSREFVRRHNGSKPFQQFYFRAQFVHNFFWNIHATIKMLKSDFWNFVKTQGTRIRVLLQNYISIHCGTVSIHYALPLGRDRKPLGKLHA